MWPPTHGGVGGARVGQAGGRAVFHGDLHAAKGTARVVLLRRGQGDI